MADTLLSHATMSAVCVDLSSLPARLLAHVFDPELDQSNPREFVIYACPQGNLGRQIEDYMEANLCRCGRNGAHKSFPHVTLCQFFKVSGCLYVGSEGGGGLCVGSAGADPKFGVGGWLDKDHTPCDNVQ